LNRMCSGGVFGGTVQSMIKSWSLKAELDIASDVIGRTRVDRPYGREHTTIHGAHPDHYTPGQRHHRRGGATGLMPVLVDLSSQAA